MTQDHYDQVTAAATAAGHTRSTWIYLAIQRIIALDQAAAHRTDLDRARAADQILNRTADHQWAASTGRICS
jgi:hypothetical protein